MPHNLLAVELWHAIAQELPRDDTRTLLAVSRTFHAVALRILFNSTVLYIGEPSTGPKRRRREEAARGLLERIPRDEQLAHAIVSIRVFAGDGGVEGKAGWARSIARALGSLAHLRSFEWLCTPNSYTILPKRVVATLIQSCPNVDSLTYSCSDRGAEQSDVHRISGLRTLTYTTWNMDGVLEDVLTANRTTLRDLTLAAPLIVDLSMLDLSALTRLDIHRGFRSALVEPILASATQLRELSLYVTPDALPVISFQRHALASLRSLRLVGLGSEHVLPLASFIAHTPRLLRLHVAWTEAVQREESWTHLVGALPLQLRVLGISLLPSMSLEQGAVLVDTLCAKMPSSVRTLYVRCTHADKIPRASLRGVEDLVVHSYSNDMIPAADAPSFVTAAFTASPALRFLSADFLPDSYGRRDGLGEIEHASSIDAGPDMDWLFPESWY